MEHFTSPNSKGLPLTASLARFIIVDLFKTKNLWKRSELAKEVEKIHLSQGSIKGMQDTLPVVKKALRNLLDDGKVENPASGQWRWLSEVSNQTATQQDSVILSSQNTIDSPENQAENLTPEKQMGEGPESIYLYYNPNDRKLAEYEGRDIWECKIGRTSSDDPRGRIIAQGAKTALSRLPVVGLLIKTDDSSALEKALHASLRILELEVEDSLGSEWFMTSPKHVESWYHGFQDALKQLRGNETSSG